MYNLVIIRHGQSQWNLQNRFTGWRDIDLTPRGHEEAVRAAELLQKIHFQYDVAVTSVLKRAIRTLWIILDEMDKMWTPVIKSWRLNERHYGELTGSNKLKMIEKYGEEQVHLWRRSYKISPPDTKEQNPAHDSRYTEVQARKVVGESLKQTQIRLLPFWNNTLVPALQDGAKLLIVAHGNSLRALIQHIEQLSDEDILTVEIPTGQPMAYHLSHTDLSIKTGRTLIK